MEVFMGALSLRLPDDLDHALTSEAEMENKPRSAVVRIALVEYLQRMEKERFMQSMVAAASALAKDSTAIRESLEIVEATVGDTQKAIQVMEGASCGDDAEKWWK